MQVMNTEVTAHRLKEYLFVSIRRIGNDEDASLSPSNMYLSKQVSYSKLPKLTATINVQSYLVPFEQAHSREKKDLGSQKEAPWTVCNPVHCA